MSSKVVYIGGFSRGRECADNVGNALQNHYDSVEAMTFPEAMELTAEQMRAVVARKEVVSHSAGLLALYGTNPTEVHAFGAPLPAGRMRLVGRTIVKSTQMLMDPSFADFSEAVSFHRQSGSELAKIWSRESRGHWKYFLNSAISGTDSVEFARPLVDEGSKVNLIWGQDDVYYKPNSARLGRARELGVGVIFLSETAHDSLVIRPEHTLESYFSGSGVITAEQAAPIQIVPEFRRLLSRLSAPAFPPSPTE